MVYANEDTHMTVIHMRNLPNIPSPHQDARVEGAPEKKVTNFAITMSMLDQMVILLGMLKCYLVMKKTDFGAMVESITVATLIFEMIRILCRGRGIELNHTHNMKQLRLWIRIISWPFYWLHLISVLIFAVVTTVLLASHYFGKTDEEVSIFFCAVAILEAMVFLIAFWIGKVSYRRLFEKVKDKCGLDMHSINSFYNEVHYKCVTGNIFYARKMDLATFAQELLVSSLGEEQLMGARILKALLTNQQLSDDALGKIGTSSDQLILMLNWKKPSDYQEEIRYLAAVILSKLVDTEQNVMRVAGIQGAMKSISSLLYSSSTCQGHKYNPLQFRLLGLSILMNLAKEHDNCTKICNDPDLLRLILNFTSICQDINQEAIMESLQVVNMLADRTGKTGLVFRRKITEVVFTGRNFRDILRHGGPHLQRLALKVLTNLAMDGEAREHIGRTGGMVEELFKLFFQSGMTNDQNMLRKEAGKTLAMLILQNKANCSRILNQERIVERLTEAVKDPVISVSSSRILQKLCAFAAPHWHTQLSSVVACFTQVLNSIMENNQDVELLEVSLGLAAQMLKFMSPHKLAEELRRACVSDDKLVKRLVAILPVYRSPSLKVPQIRRFAIELAVGMMTINKKKYAKLLKDAEIGIELNRISETTSEIEYFNLFSGDVGLSQHQVSLDLLLEKAFKLLKSPLRRRSYARQP